MYSPKRTCVACREIKLQNDFFRVSLKKGENIAHLDKEQQEEGRGAYVCKNTECVLLAEKKKAFNRSFRKPVGNEVYAELKEALNG